jgi:hypothetical protein
MNNFKDVIAMSPFPIVDLEKISAPQSGFHVRANKACIKYYNRDGACKKHYENLLATNSSESLVQCPHGFSSIAFQVGSVAVAFTGIIPYPRLGGKEERHQAKTYPETKISTSSLHQGLAGLLTVETTLNAIKLDTLKNYSMAFHEIRKLNRTVKQTAERLCMRENSVKPDAANPDLVQIWKSADLMSRQFDIIEILANEGLAELPLNSSIEIYRIFDKCVRIYQPNGPIRRIRIWSPSGYYPKIRACDKTFPIIPTVLIENSLKYSSGESGISISITPEEGNCIVKLSNTAKLNKEISEAIFKRGKRISTDKDGSGNGLYVAQLVAKQHRTKIEFEQVQVSDTEMKCTFTMRFIEG